MKVRSPMSSRAANAENSSQIRSKTPRVVVDQVHLVDREHHVRHPQQRGQERVPAGLLGQPVARVDQHDGQVGGGRAGHHVAGVLDVAGGVGDDELAPGRREVAVGDVDGDALFPLGAQAVGQQGQVGVVLAPVPAGPLDRLQLIGEDRLGVVEQPPDQRPLAVVDRAGRREPQDIHPGGERGAPPAADRVHQKYPSRFRSSMAASLIRSSARVWPRSVIRVAATSVMTSATVGGRGRDRPRAGHVAHRPVPHGRGEQLLVLAPGHEGAVGQQHAVPLEDQLARARSRWTAAPAPPARCTPRCPARSSWTAGTPGCARRGASGCCTGSTAPAAGSSGPTGRTRPGTRTPAPWPGPSPRPAARRRTARRTGAPRSRPAG